MSSDNRVSRIYSKKLDTKLSKGDSELCKRQADG